MTPRLRVRRHALLTLFLASAASIISGSTFAQSQDLVEMNFEDLVSLNVSTASKFIQSAREAPSAVEVVTRDDIRRHGWRTLTEAMQSFTGVYVSTDRLYDFLGARGFLVPGDYNNRFLVLLDGQRSNDNVFEQGSLGDELPLDLGLVERIEYVPGPGSSIYGSNAVFGVINVITRRAEEMPPLQLATRLTQRGGVEGRATLSQLFDSGASLVLSLTEAKKYGYDQAYDDPNGNLVVHGGGVSPDGIAHDLDRMRQHKFFGRYEDRGASVAIRYGNREYRPSSALYGTLFDDPGLRAEDTFLSILGRYQRQLAQHLGIEARVEYGRMTYRADYPYDDGSGNRYLNHDDTLGSWWATDVRLLHNGFAGHTLIAGVETQRDTANRQRNYDLDAAVNPPIDVDSRSHRSSAYLQDEWAFAADWRLNVGLRHDNYSVAAAATSPRLALIWLATDSSTFKLLSGRAHRVANAYERDYSNTINYLANPGLLSESIRTLELVWDQRLGRQQNFRLSLFDYHYTDLIAQVDTGGGVLQYQNQPTIKASGVETSWRYQAESGAKLSASLGINDVEDANGKRPGVSPRWVAKLRGSAPLPGDVLVLACEINSQAATEYDWTGTTQRLPSRALVDLTLSSVRVAPGLEGHLRIRNLFDRRYQFAASSEVPVPTVPGYRRTIDVGIRYNF